MVQPCTRRNRIAPEAFNDSRWCPCAPTATAWLRGHQGVSMSSYLTASACLLGLMAPALASAQQTAPAPTPPAAAPTSPTAPPEIIAPAPDTPSTGQGVTGGKAVGGVVTPPNVDPGMTVTPPADTRQTMPVIPPPGGSGANPSAVPK